MRHSVPFFPPSSVSLSSFSCKIFQFLHLSSIISISLSLSPWMNRLTCVQKHMPRLSRRPHFSAFLPIQIENVFSSSLPINSMHLSHAGREEKWKGSRLPIFFLLLLFFFSIRKISWHSRNDPTLSLVLYKNNFFPNNITQSLIDPGITINANTIIII